MILFQFLCINCQQIFATFSQSRKRHYNLNKEFILYAIYYKILKNCAQYFIDFEPTFGTLIRL